MISRGNRCHCRCHRIDNYKHMGACCCPHRSKNWDGCPKCGPIEQAKLKEFTEKLRKMGLMVK